MKPALVALFLIFNFSSYAQQFSISGKITNQEGKPVPFASVFIKNTTIGVSANSEGTYLLRLNGGMQEIQYKAVG